MVVCMLTKQEMQAGAVDVAPGHWGLAERWGRGMAQTALAAWHSTARLGLGTVWRKRGGDLALASWHARSALITSHSVAKWLTRSS